MTQITLRFCMPPSKTNTLLSRKRDSKFPFWPLFLNGKTIIALIYLTSTVRISTSHPVVRLLNKSTYYSSFEKSTFMILFSTPSPSCTSHLKPISQKQFPILLKVPLPPSSPTTCTPWFFTPPWSILKRTYFQNRIKKFILVRKNWSMKF